LTDVFFSQVYRINRDLRSCPADRDDLGASTWKLLHTMSVNFPETPSAKERSEMQQFVTLFGRLYPCKPCAEDFAKDIRDEGIHQIVVSNLLC
jgi:hypothetical protein